MSNTNKSASLMQPENAILILWLVALALCYYSDQRIMKMQRDRIVQLEAAMKIHHVDVPVEIRP